MHRISLLWCVALILLVSGGDWLFAEEVLTKRLTLERLPSQFVIHDPRHEYEWSSPAFSRSGGAFRKKEEHEAYTIVERIFVSSAGCKLGARLVEGGPDRKAFKAPPFQVLTSPPSGTLGHSWINNCRVAFAGDWEGSNMTQFDLVDLFGVAPDRNCHRFLSQLDSSGTLILPFAGVDFEQLKGFPKGVTSLVVYHSEIGEDFAKVMRENHSVNRLVLWGCHAEDGLDPGVFAPFSNSLKELIVISCSGSLTRTVVSAPWREVEHFTINSMPNCPLRHYVMPNLNRITYYFQSLGAQPDRSDSVLRSKQGYAAVLFRGRGGVLEFVEIGSSEEDSQSK